MPKNLAPTHICQSIFDIPFDELQGDGVKVLAFDVDNTLVVQNAPDLNERTKKFLIGLLKKGFVVYLASNSLRNLKPIADSFGGIIVRPPKFIFRKPSQTFFKNLLEQTKVLPHEIVMVGDKYFFDVKPALKLDMKAILINPLGKDLLIDRLLRTRTLENRALKKMGLKRAVQTED